MRKLQLSMFLIVFSTFLIGSIGHARGTPSAAGTAMREEQDETLTDVTPTPTPAPTAAKQEASWTDHAHLSYFTIFHGSRTEDFWSSKTVDNKGLKSRQNINFDGDLTAAYMFDHNIGAGVVVPFLAVPVRGQGLVLGDVGLKAFNKRTISSGGFTLYTNIILQAPTSDYSQDRHMSLGVKTTPYFRYAFADSRFSVGAWSELKDYLGVTKGQTFKVYVAPYVNYRITKNFSLNLEYELEARHWVGNKDYWDLTLFQTDLLPGVVWNITPKLMFNPYLQIFTTDAKSTGNTAFGAVLSLSIL